MHHSLEKSKHDGVASASKEWRSIVEATLRRSRAGWRLGPGLFPNTAAESQPTPLFQVLPIRAGGQFTTACILPDAWGEIRATAGGVCA